MTNADIVAAGCGVRFYEDHRDVIGDMGNLILGRGLLDVPQTQTHEA